MSLQEIAHKNIHKKNEWAFPFLGKALEATSKVMSTFTGEASDL